MFTNQDLINSFPTWKSKPRKTFKKVFFSQDDFRDSSTEEEIFIYFGQKNDFSGAIDFYFETLFDVLGDLEDFQKSFLIEEIHLKFSEEQFLECVNQYLSGLKNKYEVSLQGTWIDGMKMAEEWDDIFLLAETEIEFCAFSWITTA